MSSPVVDSCSSYVYTSEVDELLAAILGAIAELLRERPFGFHGISLLISPIIAVLVLSSVGTVMRTLGKKVTPLEAFGYGFAFALGVAVLRFLFAQ